MILDADIKEIDNLILLQEVRAREHALEPIIKRFTKDLREFFEKEKEGVIAKLRKIRLESKQLLETREEDILFQILDPGGQADLFASAALSFLEDGISLGEASAINRISFLLNFDVKFELASEWTESHAIQFGKKAAVEVSETTNGLIRQEIAEALDKGEGIPDMIARIEKVYENATDYRAEMIARTETSNACNGARHGVYEELRVPKHKWFYADTGCPICEANADAGAIPLDQPFPSGHLRPPAHPNCICDEYVDEECYDDNWVDQIKEEYG